MCNKLCKDCAFWRDEYCSMRRVIIPSDVRVLNCEMFELKVMPTLFNRITQSPEVLAEKLLYAPLGEFCKLWYSTVLPGEHWNVKEEAIAATVAKLTEVANGN